MGNGVSSESAATAATSTVSPGSGKRRIVKAQRPMLSPSDVGNLNTASTPTHKRDDDEFESPDGSGSNHNKRSMNKQNSSSKTREKLPFPIAESPSVARELELEQLEEQKQERLETTNKNRKARREKRLEERRKKDSSPSSTNNIQDKDAVPTTPRTVQANPFSKFLSVFSVEPAYPEHKRSYEISENDDVGRSGKKPRSVTDTNDDEKTKADTKKETLSNIPSSMLAASAVAVVAIIAILVLRASRK